MPLPGSNAAFAEAFAPLMLVVQKGVERPAMPADILELIEPPRYLLKARNEYAATEGKGWSLKQKEAIVIPDLDAAREFQEMGLREYGVRVRIVRLRRRGTVGLEACRLRPDVRITEQGGLIDIGVSAKDAQAMLAALTGGTDHQGKA
jgi:hypothetical protein